VAHLSPDTPAVDVSLVRDGTEQPLATDLGYGDVGDYRQLPAGRYAVAVRAAGATPSTPPVLSTFVDLPAGGASTVALSGRFDDLGLDVVNDDLAAPPAGSARVRVLDGTGGAATVTVEGTAMDAAGTIVPGGSADVAVTVDGGPPTHLPMHLPAGAVLSLLVLRDAEGAVTVRPVVDAAAPAVVPSGPVPAGGGPASSAGLALGAVLAGVGVLALRRSARAVPLAVALGVALLPAPAAASGDVVTTVATAARGLPVPGAPAPVRVRVPAVGIDGPLTAVGLDGGALVPPDDVQAAGWFAGGPAPGDVGPAVLAGHVNGGGRDGLFAHLDEVAVGDEVLVTGADGVVRRFTVTAVDRYPKGAFPTDAVYGSTTGAELRLITCGGAFDPVAHSYLENVVVSARLTP
jgi:hypothetical protein